MKELVYSLTAILFVLITFTACNDSEDGGKYEIICPSCNGLGEFINWCGGCAGLVRLFLWAPPHRDQRYGPVDLRAV